MFNFFFEVEHIVPLAHGGGDEQANQALACRSCNVFKSQHLVYTDPGTSQVAPLYHPRLDQWEAHFLLEPERGWILGRTSVGRATVDCLRMNSDAQLQARRQWIRLGVYP